MPPSDEGGGTSIASDGGRDRLICLLNLSLILTSFDSSPSRVEPNIAFPLRGEGVTAGDGRGVPIIPTNSILQHRHDIFRFQLSTLHLSHSPLKKSQIKIKLPIDKSNKILYTIKADKKVHTSGCSAAGSAPHLGCGCRRFDSCHSDQNSSFNFGWDCYFLCI